MLFSKKGQRVMRIFAVVVAILVALSMTFTYFAYLI
jgi:hypothetical protein